MQSERQAELDAAHDLASADLRAQAATQIRDGRLEEAARLLARGRDLFPDDVDLLLDQAALAETTQDWDGAIEILDRVIERFPETEDAYLRAALLCRRLDRAYEAEMILVDGMCRFPAFLELFAEYASMAEARRDWKHAARRARLLCERFPQHAAAHTRLATALKHAGRPQDAERVLLLGQEHVPQDPDLLMEHAELAAAREDWVEAARRFDTAREQLPESWWAWKRLADMLKRSGRIAEAEAALLDGQSRFPHERDLFLEHADLAADRSDWTVALQRFEIARERFPNFWWSWKRVADILKAAGRTDEAEAALLDGRRRFPQERGLFLDYAELAADRQDWAEAQLRFADVRDRFTDFWWPSKRLAETLKAAGRTRDAEAVLLDGQARFPQEAGLFFDHAELAAGADDPTETLRRFEAVRERFPGLWWSWKRLGDTLKSIGRIAEAEAVLLDGQGRFPQEMALFFDHAELAADRNDWTEALRRFEIVRKQFPDIWWTYRRMAEICRYLERFDDAEAILLEGQRQFPDEPAMYFDYADIAHRASRYQQALERYRAVHERFPDNYWGYVRLAVALKTLGLHGDAEAILIDAMKAFPDQSASILELCFLTGQIATEQRRISLDELAEMVASRIATDGEILDLLNARAQLARLAGDYPDYMRQLNHIVAVYPNAPGISEKIVTAREILLGNGDNASGTIDDPLVRPPAGDDVPQSPRELFACFESLGGGGPDGSTSYGCEFGFAQRKLDIEPLSLLRWTGVALPNLTRLFARDFEGIGGPETTLIEYVELQYDWRSFDTMYELRCDHTHLDRLIVPQEQARKMMCQRMSFLARKLREDLEDGEKIFVYRYTGTVQDETEMLALAEAVNGFGKNMLLFVCRADEHHEPFTVRLVHPGLVVGYLDWFGADRVGEPTDGTPLNMVGWTRVCEAAYRLWRSAQRAA